MEGIEPLSMMQWMHEYGVSIVFMALVSVLLFLYFWKVINAKPESLRLFGSVTVLIEKISADIQAIKVTIAEIKTMLDGNFRNKGGGQ